MTSLTILTNHPGASLLPFGMTSHSEIRSGAQKAVLGMVSSSMATWWRKETTSKRENMRLLHRASRILSTRGMLRQPSEMMAFTFLWFTMMQTPPSFVGMTTMWLE